MRLLLFSSLLFRATAASLVIDLTLGGPEQHTEIARLRVTGFCVYVDADVLTVCRHLHTFQNRQQTRVPKSE